MVPRVYIIAGTHAAGLVSEWISIFQDTIETYSTTTRCVILYVSDSILLVYSTIRTPPSGAKLLVFIWKIRANDKGANVLSGRYVSDVKKVSISYISGTKYQTSFSVNDNQAPVTTKEYSSTIMKIFATVSTSINARLHRTRLLVDH